MRMLFNVARVRQLLKEKGKVYTVRKFADYDLIVFVKDIGVCKTERVIRVNRWDELKDFVAESGFETLGEWIEAIEGFGCKEGKSYLYEVCIKQRKKGDRDV